MNRSKRKLLLVMMLFLVSVFSIAFCFSNSAFLDSIDYQKSFSQSLGGYSLDLIELSTKNSKITTSSGNVVGFSIDDYDYDTYESIHFFDSNGSIKNKTKLSGITSISINLVSTSQNLKISYGWEYDNYVVTATINNLNPIYTFNDEKPSYFKIYNDGENSVAITSMNILYSCTETPCPEKYYLQYELIGEEYSVISCNKSVTSVTIPSEINGLPVTSIGDKAFKDCKSLVSITIPDGITSIGDSAFSNCGSIESISLPNSVASIGSYAFYFCTSLRTITIPDSTTIISDNTFYYCTLLYSADLGSGVKTIQTNAFRYCKSLYTITIPNNVTSIADYAFSNCYTLTEVINNSSLDIVAGSTSNGNVAYYAEQVIDNKSQSKLQIVDNKFVIFYEKPNYYLVKYIGTDGYVNIPNYVTKIGEFSFCENNTIRYVNIPNSVESIGNSAFDECHLLSFVSMSDNVVSIGSYAFFGCYRLSSFVVPAPCESIGNNSFANCHCLAEVINYSDIEIIKGINTNGAIGYYAKQIISDSSQSKLHNINEEFITYVDDSENCLVRYIGDNTNIVVPSNVTSIGDSAFEGLAEVKSISLSSVITLIGKRAFNGCKSLLSINIPGATTSILKEAFSGCSSLISITLHEGLSSIAEWAFSSCSSLYSIIIPESVTSMGSYVFKNCQNITIYCRASKWPSNWSSNFNPDDRPEVWGYNPE